MPFDPQGEDTSIRDSLAMRQMGTTISPKKVKKALKPYKLDKGFGKKVRGKSDEDLYNMAQSAVIKWWQRSERAEITSRDPGKKNTAGENRALNRMEGRVDKALDRVPDGPAA